MSRYILVSPLFCFFAIVSIPCHAVDLPSLMSDRYGGAVTQEHITRPLKQGQLDLGFNRLDYRVSDDGLRASMPLAYGVSSATLGYDRARLQLDWGVRRANIRLALTSGGGSSGYRLEFARRF